MKMLQPHAEYKTHLAWCTGASKKPIHSWPAGACDDDLDTPLLRLRENLLIDKAEQRNGRNLCGRIIDASCESRDLVLKAQPNILVEISFEVSRKATGMSVCILTSRRSLLKALASAHGLSIACMVISDSVRSIAKESF